MTHSRCHKVSRWLMICLLITSGGGTTFLFSGCDPEVTTSLLAGFNDLSVSLVDTFFLALQLQQDQDSGTDTTTTTTP